MKKSLLFPRAVAPFLGLLLCALPGAGSGFGRLYDLGQVRGNLVPNFSFENLGEGWIPATGSFAAVPRFRADGLCAGCRAVTGSFAGRVTGNNPTGSVQRLLASDRFPILPGQAYTLSFYYRASSLQGSLEPRIRFFASRLGAVLQEVTGPTYASASGWTFRSFSFTSPSTAQAADLALVHSNAAGEAGTLAFDDVVLEEGNEPSYRGQMKETIQFGDGLGRSRQTLVRLVPNLPVGTGLPACLEPYSIYSQDGSMILTDVRDRAVVHWGKVGSETLAEVGVEGKVYGDLVSRGNVILRDRAIVEGNVVVGGTYTPGNGVEISGSVILNAQVPSCPIPVRTVTSGSQNHDVFADQTLTLAPGTYGNVHVFARATLKLASGVYVFQNLTFEADAKAALTLTGAPIRISTRDFLTFGDRMKTEFTGQDDPFAVEYYSRQTGELRVGPEARVSGVIMAPSAEIAIYSRAAVQGALYGRRVRLEPDAVLGPADGRGLKNFLALGQELDAFARPVKTPLPTPVRLDNTQFIAALLDSANAFFRASAGNPEAGDNAFAEKRYADEPSPRLLESGSPGAPWRVGGGHTVAKDYRFAADFSIPSRIEDPATAPAGVQPLTLYWERDADSNFALIWTNDRSQIVQSATNLDRAGADASLWKWSVQRHEYYRNGRVRKVYTPLDVASGTDQFSLAYNFNAQGLLTSSNSPGKGLMTFWYNQRGQSRFSQDEGQRSRNEYTYTEYDAKGRIQATGLQIVPAMTQAIADLDRYDVGTKSEYVGYVYDDLSTFQARTGFPLSGIMPGFTPQNASNKTVCAYHRNTQTAPPGFTAQDRLVADFYSYDARGNLIEMRKFLGPVRKDGQKRQRLTYAYDERDRIVTMTLYKSASNSAIVNQQNYRYDNLGVVGNLGRVTQITGQNGKALEDVTPNPWGPIRSVILGGDGSGRNGTRVTYEHHIQGWLKQMRAVQLSSGKTVHQEFLGYEDKAVPSGSVPDPTQRRFGGSVTQQLNKFASDVNSLRPVRLVNYAYDEMGRMRQADYFQNSNANPLSQLETIKFGELAMGQSETLDSRFDYDLNGRITGQRTGGVSPADSARYFYQDGTYRLDRVTGRLSAANTRNMSNTGNFQYDGRGAMVGDDSKLLDVTYGWDLMPVRLQVDSGAPAYSREYQFYDAQGRRAAKLETRVASGAEKRQRLQGYTANGTRNFKEWREIYNASEQVQDSAEIATLQGVYSPIGRLARDRFEFHVKNHSGSVMRAVEDNGDFGATGPVLDYHAYGDPVTLKEGATQDKLNEKFIGKEYESLARLHYFGARFYDSELGLWLTPDPLSQFHNPYGYPSDPVSLVDNDGQIIPVILIVGLVVGAYLGGSAANGNFNPLEWDYTNENTYMGIIFGGVIGGMSGGMITLGIGAGAATVTGGMLVGAGIGGGTAFVMTSISQAKSGQFDPGAMYKAWGIGTLVGGATGAVGGLGTGPMGTTGNWFTKALLNGGLEAAKAYVYGEDPLKAAALGFVVGCFNNTGGFKLAKLGLGGKLVFQAVATTGTSIGRNWVAGRDLLSKVNVGIGPVNFVVGKDATLMDQLSANALNLGLNGFGLANGIFGGGDVRWNWDNLTFAYSGGWLNPTTFKGGDDFGTGLGVVLGWNQEDVLSSSYADHEMIHVWQSRVYGIDHFLALWGISGADKYGEGGNFFEGQAQAETF